MTKLRLYDLRVSDLPQALGLCAADLGRVAAAVNSAQRRLIFAKEAGDEGWFGTFAEIAFNVCNAGPYITLPREIARLEAVNVIDHPVSIVNQFAEYLQFGNGRMPKLHRSCVCGGACDVRSRNNAVTFTDLTNAPQQIVIFSTNASDNGKRVLIQGLDAAGNVIYTRDGGNQTVGLFVTLAAPFAVAYLPGSPTPMQFAAITGIQKDVTQSPIQIFQQDPVDGTQVLLHTMEPGEQTAWYRRYYFNQLPRPHPGPIQVSAIAKLELIPVAVDTDYCLIQNPEAITHEAQAIRYSRMDNAEAKQMAQAHHIQAIRLLNGELSHYYGVDEPSVSFKPFGSATLERQRIGMI